MAGEDDLLELEEEDIDIVLSGVELVVVDDDNAAGLDTRSGLLGEIDGEGVDSTELEEVGKGRETGACSGITEPVPFPYNWK